MQQEHVVGGDKFHKGSRNGPDNCIEKPLGLSKLEIMVRIWTIGGGIE